MTSFQLTEDPQIVRRDDGLLCRPGASRLMAAVKAGTHPVPNAESLIAELPTLVWG